MEITVEGLIKEAELAAKSRFEGETLSKLANADLEKMAAESNSPFVKLAAAGDFSLKAKYFTKTAAPGAGALMGWLGKEGLKRIGVGGAIGAATGAMANKDDRMGGALKGATLGAIGGAAYHQAGGLAGVKGLWAGTSPAGVKDHASRWLGKEVSNPASVVSAREGLLKNVNRTSRDLNQATGAASRLDTGLRTGTIARKADAFGGRRLDSLNERIRGLNEANFGSQHHNALLRGLESELKSSGLDQSALKKTWFGLGNTYKEVGGKTGRQFSEKAAKGYMERAEAGRGVLAKKLTNLEGRGAALGSQMQTADKITAGVGDALKRPTGLPTLGWKDKAAAPTAHSPATAAAAQAVKEVKAPIALPHTPAPSIDLNTSAIGRVAPVADAHVGPIKPKPIRGIDHNSTVNGQPVMQPVYHNGRSSASNR